MTMDNNGASDHTIYSIMSTHKISLEANKKKSHISIRIRCLLDS